VLTILLTAPQRISESSLNLGRDGQNLKRKAGSAGIFERRAELEKEQLIASMIHSTESVFPADEADMERLNGLALEIDGPTSRDWRGVCRVSQPMNDLSKYAR
jgi:hypothetical protein